MTPYQKFASKWGGCENCSLHETRTKVVLAKGKLPCDAMFCGEAPGKSEDILGQPFIGPAGQLLDTMIAGALDMTADSGSCMLRFAFTNVICCIPLDSDGDKTEEPPDEAMRACAKRLEEFVAIAKPKLIVCVGTVAQDWLMTNKNKMSRKGKPGHPVLGDWQGKMVEIVHPAHVLRAPVISRELTVKRNIMKLANAFKDLLEGDLPF